MCEGPSGPFRQNVPVPFSVPSEFQIDTTAIEFRSTILSPFEKMKGQVQDPVTQGTSDMVSNNLPE
jgi:hypothetical protein